MKFAQLLRRGLGRGSHQQVFGLLVHREEHDLADVGLVAEQHDDAVHARRNAAMGRCAILEGAVHAAEFLQQNIFRIAGDLEGLLHHIGPVVTDGAG